MLDANNSVVGQRVQHNRRGEDFVHGTVEVLGVERLDDAQAAEFRLEAAKGDAEPTRAQDAVVWRTDVFD